MTREVYNMLSKVLDSLEKELEEMKSMKASEEQPQEASNSTIRIKIDMNISIEE